MDERALLDVVAGVLLNQDGDYLLSSRPEGKVYAGYWEFAGGKVEANETKLDALKREFEEELDIQIDHATPWLTQIHAYEHALVHLHFFRIAADAWSGEIQAKEGQKWSWQRPGDANVTPILPANNPILAALAIPNELTGSLTTGFYGYNRTNEYRVVPIELAKTQHQHVLIAADKLLQRGNMPSKKRVWVVIKSEQEWLQCQDADAVVWRVDNEKTAEEIISVLKKGVSMPVLVYASTDFLYRYRQQWLSAGVQTVILNEEIEQT